LTVHVDDMLVATSSESLREWFVKELGKKVELKVELDPKWLLHMHIKYDRAAGVLQLDQSAYLQEVLDKFDPKGTKTSRITLPDCTYLHPTPESDLTPDQVHLYQAIVGSLMYAATHTRPDLSFTVSHLGKFLHSPSQVHLSAALHVLYYVRATLSYGLTYRSGAKKNGGYVLAGWCDANFANEPDRHSVSGNLQLLYDNLVDWGCKSQKTVSLSTAEAEITSGSDLTRNVVASRGMCVNISILSEKDSVPVFVDNSPAVAVITNPGYYARMKHLGVQQKFILEAHKNKIIYVKWCGTNEQLADCLTKPCSGKKLVEFYHQVMCAS
jgi:hypothetical protein